MKNFSTIPWLNNKNFNQIFFLSSSLVLQFLYETKRTYVHVVLSVYQLLPVKEYYFHKVDYLLLLYCLNLDL